jgi:FtsP/CotA-like multicopper oxidase with cupredoxin domain
MVTPKSGIVQQVDVSAIAHTYGGVRTINGKAEDLRVSAHPGEWVRVRVINTDNGPMKVWTNGSYRLLAVDGADVHRPTEVTGRTVTLTAGARADLEVQVPSDGTAVRVQLSRSTAVVIGTHGVDTSVPPQPAADLNLLAYGSPAPLGFDPARPTRRFDYLIDRRPDQRTPVPERPDVRGARGRCRRCAY